MLYALTRPVLFAMDAEQAHGVTLSSLDVVPNALLSTLFPLRSKPVQCLGMTFPNPVGLAAGLDKNGAHIDALGALGFGFIEIGTITPRPQPGNPKPRLFRLPKAQAIINRMGFNNLGVDHLVRQVERRRYQGVLGMEHGNFKPGKEGELALIAAYREVDLKI